MLLHWIEQTRKKPKAVRNRYAFLGAFIFTGCIVGVWALSLPAHFAGINQKYDESSTQSRGLFSGFVSDVKAQFAASFASHDLEDTPESEAAVGTDIVQPSIQLDDAAIQDLRLQHENNNRPAGKVILIGTSSVPNHEVQNTPVGAEL